MRSAIWRHCSGGAHGNAHIDHCWTCAPWWEIFPACPDCGGILRRPARSSRPDSRPIARCTNTACASVRRWFDTSGEPTRCGPLTWLGCVFVEIAVMRMLGGSGDARRWIPTHEIALTDRDGNTEIVRVQLAEGAAYTRDEWTSGTTVDWEYDEDAGWTFQGRPAPQAWQTVEVRKLGGSE